MTNSKLQFQDPGEGIHEAEILEVLVAEGDAVEEGQQVLVVETDKAAFEVHAPRSGVVGKVQVHPGDTVQVGDTLMTFEDGAHGDDTADGSESEPPKPAPERKGSEARPEKQEDHEASDESFDTAPPDARQREPEPEPSEGEDPGRRDKGKAEARASVDEGLARGAGSGRPPVPATPATRRLARELGVDLNDVVPSGEKGRVLDEDVRAFADKATEPRKAKPGQEGRGTAQEQRLPDFSSQGRVERQPLRSIRKTTAERMARAWAEVPHVTHHDLVDISELERWRQRLAPKVEAEGGKLTLTILVMKALCSVLREYPRFNASLDTERGELIIKHYYHLGVAVDTERGLLVPVVRDAAAKSLSVLSKELVELADRARQGKSKREELAGSSFTITNIGSLGGTGFTPMINYPEVAILGLARATLQPVVVGEFDSHDIATRLMLPISLAFDHRVIDGAEAARFVARLKQRLADVEEYMLSI